VSTPTKSGHRSPEWLLIRCQVTVVKAGRKHMTARVVDVGVWTVKKRRGTRWSCSCPAAWSCAHISAVALVADMPVSDRKAAGE
jgi:hypothetical protein